MIGTNETPFESGPGKAIETQGPGGTVLSAVSTMVTSGDLGDLASSGDLADLGRSHDRCHAYCSNAIIQKLLYSRRKHHQSIQSMQLHWQNRLW